MTEATPTDRARRERSLLIECAIVAATVFAAYAASHPDAVATLGRLYDDVVYLSVAKSMADGHGYRSAQLVGTPVHVKFPPLLPAVYAVGWMAFGSLDAVARLALWLNLVVTSAAAGALWWLTRRELGVGPVFTALFVGVPILTDRAMFYFSGAASEPWMLLGWTVALLLARHLTSDAAGRGSAAMPAAALVLGLTLAATTLARTQALVIAAGVLVGLMLSRVGWRTVVISFVAAAIPLAVWNVWHSAMTAQGPLSPLPDQKSYLAWIPTTSVGALTRFAVSMTRASVPLYWASAADILVGWTSSKTLLLAAVILAAGAVGTVMLARGFPAMAVSLLATLGVLAVWPYVQDRFLTPVLPVLGAAAAFAAERTVARAPRRVRVATVAVSALVCAVLLAQNIRLRAGSALGSRQSPYVAAISEIVGWVERNTAPTDNIMVSWGGVIYLRTGRRTSIPNPEEPTLGTSVLDSPYAFYATRLLADSVDDVIIWDRAPGRAATWLRSLGQRCPGLMTEAASAAGEPAPTSVHYYRVRRDVPCLAQLANAGSSPAR